MDRDAARGHFAALEEPELLAGEIRKFFPAIARYHDARSVRLTYSMQRTAPASEPRPYQRRSCSRVGSARADMEHNMPTKSGVDSVDPAEVTLPL
jgi:hypothetical protein